MSVTIPKDILDTLHELRASQLKHPYPPVEILEEPAVVLTLGMGDELYLTFDGRVLRRPFLDEDAPVHETTDPRHLAAGLVIAAHRNDLPELLSLMPPRPSDAVTCEVCKGVGWVGLPHPVDAWFVCQCSGLGWKQPQ
jgi:hypothetical protein